jgi:hypothetical protein
MWEEDPRWQAAQFRMVLGSCLFAGLLRIGMAVYLWDWSIGPLDLLGLTALAALLVYGALVWIVGNGIRLLFRAGKCRGWWKR